MDFINTAIDVKTLPAAEGITLQPVHSSYRKIMLIEWVITVIVLAIIATVSIVTSHNLRNSIGWLVVVAATILISAFYYISVQRSFPFLAYAAREKDIIHQKGWIIRRIKTCPFNRIQNCSVQSGPLERKYGLASLTIYTAGTNGADMRISGLLQEDAEKLRYFILHKIHTEPDETA